MHAALTRLLARNKISQQLAEQLDAVSPGNYCVHRTWGVGKVISWDLPSQTLVINFEERPNHTLNLATALRNLKSLSPDHFLVLRYESLDKLKNIAESSQPVELVKLALSSCNNQLKVSELESYISGRIVPASKWKSWWDKVRPVLQNMTDIVMPTSTREPICLRKEKLTYTGSVIADYKARKDLKNRVAVLSAANTELLVQEPDQTAALLRQVFKDIASSASAALGNALDLSVLATSVAKAVNFEETPLKGSTTLELLVNYPDAIPEAIKSVAATRLDPVLALLKDAYGEEWITRALNIFDFGGARVTPKIASILLKDSEESQKAFSEHLTLGVSNQTLEPDALAWICRFRASDAKPFFNLKVGMAMLNLIDQDAMSATQARSSRLKKFLLETQELVKEMVQGVPYDEVRQFAIQLYGSPAFSVLDRRAFVARLMSVYPALSEVLQTEGDQNKEDDTLFVSWDSLEKKKAEYDELVNVKIPENKHNKAVFRAEGDLRENAGYQDAKELERVLERRRAELERDLAVARGTDFKGADASSVAMGTVVTLKPVKGGQDLTYTILGAWDSDPEKAIISYMSVTAKELIGSKVGDTVRIMPLSAERKQAFVISAIAPYAE